MDDSKNTSQKTKYLRIMCLLSLLYLVLFIFTSLTAKRSSTDESQAESDTATESIITEYVYVDKIVENNTQILETPADTTYVVREYMGKIGIFLTDGTLVRVIEVYAKTLPEADRRLLEEGFEIIGNQQLYSVIEDYGS